MRKNQCHSLSESGIALIEQSFGDMQQWRRDIHRHPELAFEEKRTARFVADTLRGFNVDVVEEVGGTGVVGMLRAGDSSKSIGLRADMDALPITEENEFSYRSATNGVMHACGHDGHTTMLLGAARYLAQTRQFDGIVFFIFQPAEETEAGASRMIEEGLFTRFSIDSVYGMHNAPTLPVNTFAIQSGAVLSSSGIFEISIQGKGAHAARPHEGIDPILLGTQIVAALQSVVAQKIDPTDNVVITVTGFEAGEAVNAIPRVARLQGIYRAFSPETTQLIVKNIEHQARSLCAAQNASCTVAFRQLAPATINAESETDQAIDVAARLVGRKNVITRFPPVMGAEDFAFMLQQKPGCYVFIGNGATGEPGGCTVHSSTYDFNDEILVLGTRFWAGLVESTL